MLHTECFFVHSPRVDLAAFSSKQDSHAIRPLILFGWLSAHTREWLSLPLFTDTKSQQTVGLIQLEAGTSICYKPELGTHGRLWH